MEENNKYLAMINKELNLLIGSNENIKDHYLKIKALESKPIVFDMDSIKECLAEDWNMAEDEITIEYETMLDAKTSPENAEVIAEQFNREKSDNDEIRIFIKFDTYKKAVVTFFDVPLKLRQKDNKTLGMHMKAGVVNNKEVKVAIDDLSKLIVMKKLGELVRYDAKQLKYIPRTELMGILLQANERFLNGQASKESAEEIC